jgi:hypothetical protein
MLDNLYRQAMESFRLAYGRLLVAYQEEMKLPPPPPAAAGRLVFAIGFCSSVASS